MKQSPKLPALVALTVSLACWGAPAPLQAQSEIAYEALAHDVTALVRAFRRTIVVNPDSIHKPSEFFQDPTARVNALTGQAKVFFKVMAKKGYPADDQSEAGKIRTALEEAVKAVVLDVSKGTHDLNWQGDNEYVKKWDGKLLPARFASLVASEFNARTGQQVTFKLTTSPQLLVNKDNAPDEWETQVIDDVLLSTNKITGKPQSLDSPTEFRYLLPEFYEPPCIQCHGTQQGQEGFKIHPTELKRNVGDFAGAISIRIKKAAASGG